MEQSWTAAEDKRIRSGEPYILEGLKVDGQRFIVTVVTVGLGYCVMLLTMTFNVGVFFMCIIGIGAGSVVFRKFKPMTLVLDEVDETKECC
ncbi:hypothetical protein M427DRAFT_224318 [Gonapodya prolifera JEL478]|uniref:Copper transport protein n=1 Tax=Gonapodya prolifera (strain JEL478) TaxID=1344416 RepID=A0A139ANJ6_GONPJ|nr:hypothetical protein M427DRAFT_224318 [Gonapodya prolifera JEL478]|eukprot:KXS18214.1 hypothetical protein M427DRAFT_224318 [Gonapodya prolifera JEL478]